MAHIWGNLGVNLYHMVLGQFYLFGHSIYGNLFGLFESFFSVEFELLNINIKVEVDFLSSNILATVSINFFFKFNPLKWRLGEKKWFGSRNKNESAHREGYKTSLSP